MNSFKVYIVKIFCLPNYGGKEHNIIVLSNKNVSQVFEALKEIEGFGEITGKQIGEMSEKILSGTAICEGNSIVIHIDGRNKCLTL